MRRPSLAKAIQEFQEATGKPVKAMRLCLGGDVLLLTETPEGAFNGAEGDLWDLAGEKAIPRA